MVNRKVDDKNLETMLVRGGQVRSHFCETSEPIYLTSGFVYESAEEAEQAFNGECDRYLYSRYANPTVSFFEKKLAMIEGAKHCIGVSSGMAAVTAALLSTVKTGDRVVSSQALFGNCFYVVDTLLRQYGVDVEIIDGCDNNEWERALATPTDVVFFESPSNPTLKLVDIEFVCNLAKKTNTKVMVDNVFSTPIGQKCFELGADVVIYSATKHIDGHGRTLAGAVLSNDSEWFEDVLFTYIKNTGPSLSPFNAWNMVKGLETLSLRLERQCENALKISNSIQNNENVEKVVYLGLQSHPSHELAKKQMKNFGTMVGIYVKGGKENAFKFLNSLQIIDISNNLGDNRSLATSPAFTTHAKLSEQEKLAAGITDNFIRLSVGIENVDDLIEDINNALIASK